MVLIVRSLRRSGAHAMLRGGNGALCLIVPHAEDLGLFKEAGETLLRASERKFPDHPDLCLQERNADAVRVFTQSGKPDWRDGDHAGLLARHGRVLLLSTDACDIPLFLLQAAEGVEPLAPCDARTLRGMFHALFGRSPAAGALPDVSALSVTAISAALRTRASLTLALASLRHASHVTAAPADPPNQDRGIPSLDDLSGLGEAAEWGHSLAADLRAYRAGEIGWREMDKGAVAYGPSGTGKTTFALALASTCGVPIFIHSLARWQAMGHLGDLLKAMRKAFAEAKANAPCILFVDEIDAFGDRAKSGDSRHEQYHREVINGFLECLDGAEDRDGVIVIGATNFPGKIDPAILRPGRLERTIAIPLPDAAARAGILHYHLGGHLSDVDLMPLSRRLEGLSGADLERIVRDAKRTARRDRRPLSLPDLEAAVPPLVRLAPDAYRRTCLHEAAHALIGCLVLDETSNPPLQARAFREAPPGLPAGETLFGRSRAIPLTRAAYLGDITVLLAGLAAEELVLGDHCEGCGSRPGSDLHRATVQALALEASAGMGAHLVYRRGILDPNLLDLLHTDEGLRARVEAILQACRARARTLLAGHRTALDRLTHRLEQDGEIGFEAIVGIALPGRPGSRAEEGSPAPSGRTARTRRKPRGISPENGPQRGRPTSRTPS